LSKNVLFYFSGTGNSMTVAKSIAQGLEDVILVPMLREDALNHIDKYTESMGLVFPIHINAVPHIVVKFLEKIKLLSSVYFFAVATHGGVPGMSGLYLNKILKKQNIILDAYFEIKMINNTPKGVAPKFLMNLDWELDITPEKIDMLIGESHLSIQNIIGKIKIKEKTTLQRLPAGLKRVAYWMMSLMWYISEKSRHKLNFLLDECCTGCGTCEKVCTTKRIRMKTNKPEWVHENCSFCYACFNYCPEQAIGVEHYTKRLGRYHHPDISVDDISKQTK
jgi:ferredoxin